MKKQDSLHKSIINEIKKEVKKSYHIEYCVGEYLTFPLVDISETLRDLTLICLDNALNPKVNDIAKHLDFEDKEVIRISICKWLTKIYKYK